MFIQWDKNTLKSFLLSTKFVVKAQKIISPLQETDTKKEYFRAFVASILLISCANERCVSLTKRFATMVTSWRNPLISYELPIQKEFWMSCNVELMRLLNDV